jgi:hypothetical protein
LSYERICAQERDAFHHRLGDQDPIEGIFVKKRQTIDGDGMVAADGKLSIVILQQAAPQEAWVNLKVSPANISLDGNFPKTGGTKEKLIVRISYKPLRDCGEPSGFSSRPKEQMCVE